MEQYLFMLVSIMPLTDNFISVGPSTNLRFCEVLDVSRLYRKAVCGQRRTASAARSFRTQAVALTRSETF